jgi:hypothetical protein
VDQRERVGDRIEALRTAIDGQIAEVWTALPGIVKSVNFAQMTCTVQPAIRMMVTGSNGIQTPKDIPVLLDVPIVFPSAGGFILTLPIADGDEVLVIFASRCIDTWWQNGGYQNIQAEFRMHDLSDGFCIPGPRSLTNLVPGISSTTCQLRKVDGTAYLELTPAGAINLVAPGGVNITGALAVSGDAIIDGVNVKTHVHSGVSTGGSNTGPPV